VGPDCVFERVPARVSIPMLGAAGGVALLSLTWFAAFHIGLVEHADLSIFRGFGELGTRPRVWSLAASISRLCNEKPYLCLCAVPVFVAVARRRLWLALEIASILVGANLTTYVLKQLLAHPRAESLLGGPHPLPATSWPSGHTTAATSLALCCVLAAPSRLRPFVAAGGAIFAAGVAYSLLVINAHYPSDVLGGFLVAGIWTLLGAAGVRLADARRSASESAGSPAHPTIRQALAPLFAVLGIAIALAGVIALARPGHVVSYTQLHEGFIIGAAAIGAAGSAVAAGVALALRR